VEDHEIVGQALAVHLDRLGLSVAWPEDFAAETILTKAREFDPDVVLLDFFLDEGDSRGLIAPLVDMGARVTMFTGLTDHRLLGECLELGATGIISKGMRPCARLFEAIEEAARGKDTMLPAARQDLIAAAVASRERLARKLEAFQSLTSREQTVLMHMIEGRTAEEIARLEYLGLATVRTHIRATFTKLGVNSQLKAVAMAHKQGWPPVESLGEPVIEDSWPEGAEGDRVG
jgi:DNA-binding NarL/FixJ family response regulator